MTVTNLNKYDRYYKRADKYLTINNDDSILRPVVLTLPEPPDISLIEGYGKPPAEQKFQRHEQPQKLKRLEDRVLREIDTGKSRDKVNSYTILSKYWEILNKERDNFNQEIKYIKKVQYHLRFGYWFFNNGKPTYISPWHYLFLNFWYMEDTHPNYPEYRDKDRKTELFEWYLHTTKETFKHTDEKGKAIKKNGKFEMIELDNKVFFGSQEPKRRRSGATMRALVKMWWTAITKKGVYCTIVSDSGEHAQDAFKKKFIPAWRKSPAFLKPIWDGNNSPKLSINFSAPPNVYNSNDLGSSIDYAESAGETTNDSKKIYYLVSDEEGKNINSSSSDRWRVNKKTMHQGPAIHGFSSHPSTVEDMNDSAVIYERMWKESDFYIRMPNGQTQSGLGRMFTSVVEGYDGFVDPWGYSVVKDPTEEQLRYAPSNAAYLSKKEGSKQYFEQLRSSILQNQSQSDYRKEVRKEPMDSSEAFMGDSGDVGFPIQVIDARLAELKYKPEIRIGNLVGKGGYIDWEDNPNGRFECSKVLTRAEIKFHQQRNPIRIHNPDKGVMNSWEPIHPNYFVIGCDPVDYMSKTEAEMSKDKSVRSDGSGAVFWMRDHGIDPNDEDLATHRSNRFVMTYRNRTPGSDVFHNDMLLMCRYYGSMISIERNKGTAMIKFFMDSGYGGYLMYEIDNMGQVKKEPGIYMLSGNKDRLFEELNGYLNTRGHAEKHISFLQECKDIKRPEQMKRFDQLTSCGIALLAQKESYKDIKAERATRSRSINLSSLNLRPRSY